MNKLNIFTIVLISFAITCCAQQKNNVVKKQLLGTCEGCEAIFEYGSRLLSAVDTLPDFGLEGVKIKITGTIFQPDGKTPTSDVILYVYHTNEGGIYENKNNATNWERRHGFIRGWIKTDKEGKYTFYTLKPGVYPNRSAPAHIHITVLEPNGNYYWIEDYYFEGDPLLSSNEINPKNPRGGSSGFLNLKREGNIWVGKRDIVLGKNVADHN